MDNQGRVLLPQILRGKASLDSDVTVFGKTTYLEVHNREIFEQNLPENEMTDDRSPGTSRDSQPAKLTVNSPQGGAHDEAE